MRDLVDRLKQIPGVVAVTLGGSQAVGTATADSDWDFGLYYHEAIDPSHIEALGWAGEVYGVGEWGRIVNGGAWLTVDGAKVDLIYRDLAEVGRWSAEAEQGRFEVHREVGYVAGIATYVLAGELALCEVLAGELPRPSFPDALRSTAPRFWFRIGGGALHFAEVYAVRGDRTACLANVTQAILCAANGRLTGRGEWSLNEKKLVERAGLQHLDAVLREQDLQRIVETVSEELALQT
jgi:hypothetical protein